MEQQIRQLAATLQTPEQFFAWYCMFAGNDDYELLVQALHDPDLEAKAERTEKTQTALSRRIRRVRAMRSPYKGRQKKQPPFADRKKRVLLRLEALHARVAEQHRILSLVEFVVGMPCFSKARANHAG